MDKVTNLADANEFVVDDGNSMKLVDVGSIQNIRSLEVESSDLENMYAIAQEMVKFAHARDAAGISLPQIGIMKRAFMFLTGDDKWEMMINPEYFPSGKYVNVYERSMSYTGVYAAKRCKNIRAVYYSIDVDDKDRLVMKKQYKMMSGLRAFMFQSLTDSLDGRFACFGNTRVDVEPAEKTETINVEE